jgi:hypothetical protein
MRCVGVASRWEDEVKGHELRLDCRRVGVSASASKCQGCGEG